MDLISRGKFLHCLDIFEINNHRAVSSGFHQIVYQTGLGFCVLFPAFKLEPQFSWHIIKKTDLFQDQLAGFVVFCGYSSLNKEPGIYSARYAGEDTSYDIKNQMLLDRLQGVPREKRTARFVCAIAAVVPGHEPIVVRGTIEGYIGDKPAGENGFGYDPIFYVPDLNCSTAELSPEEKNARSHRGNALRAMREELKQYISDGR